MKRCLISFDNNEQYIDKLRAKFHKYRATGDIIRMKITHDKIKLLTKTHKDIIVNNEDVLFSYIRYGIEPDNRQYSKLLLFYDKEEYKRVNKLNYSKMAVSCISCGEELFGANGSFTCPSCGTYNTSRTSGKRVKTFSYQSKSYYIDYMNRFQGRKVSNIKQEELQKIRETAAIMGYNDREIGIQEIYQILKNAKLNKYNKDRMYIMNKIFGIPLPNISQTDLNMFYVMYDEITLAWNDLYPDGIKYQYQYICRKIMEFRSAYDKYLPYWKICSDYTKLNTLDDQWHGVCAKLGYEFIPTNYF